MQVAETMQSPNLKIGFENINVNTNISFKRQEKPIVMVVVYNWLMKVIDVI